MNHSKSGLFLMELIISILFFSLTAAVCVQLFVKAHQISRTSVNESHAISWAQNALEILKSEDGNLSNAAGILAKTEGVQIYTTSAFASAPNSSSEEDIRKALQSVSVSTLSKNADLYSASSEAFILCFDSSWNPCEFSNLSFFLKVTKGTDDQFSAEVIDASVITLPKSALVETKTDVFPIPEEYVLYSLTEVIY